MIVVTSQPLISGLPAQGSGRPILCPSFLPLRYQLLTESPHRKPCLGSLRCSPDFQCTHFHSVCGSGRSGDGVGMSPSTITSPSYSLRQGLSLNLWLSDLARLAGQQALGCCLCPPLRLWYLDLYADASNSLLQSGLPCQRLRTTCLNAHWLYTPMCYYGRWQNSRTVTFKQSIITA